MTGSTPLPASFPALPAELSIYTAGETAALWRSWFANAGVNLTEAPLIDASAVDVIDGAGVQLLIALARQLAERGLSWRLESPSPTVLVDACQALGAAALLIPGANA